MTVNLRSRVKEILDHALDLDESARAPYVDAASAGDTELRQTVWALLRDYDRAELEGFLEAPPAASRRIGQRVGAYRITSLLGRGGRGEVFEAVRDDDEFEQRVAIKFLRDAALDEDALRRFRVERQLLAGIQHSHVAKLLDGGTSSEGAPYLVMEYVDGEHIDVHCDRERLSIDERLALFLEVCGAVQSAHNQLVVHRDLKPANVLVDGDGHPKLLDFGIAKLLDAKLLDVTVQSTALDRRLLTPDYASPEQFRGEPVTVASDIYSLGVVLYELLTGHRPYSFDGLAPGEMDDVLSRRDPRRPSQAVLEARTIRTSDGTTESVPADRPSRARNATVDKLRRKLTGDLDNVVLMAMRKEPERRYQTVNALAEDIRRHLDGLPVAAREPTTSYRVGKFVRRNRAAVAMASATLLLTGLFVVSNYRARRVAEDESARARVVSQFLEDTLASANPISGRGRETTVFEVLASAEDELADAFPDNPAVEAAVRNAIGAAYLKLGEHERAEANLGRALSIRESIYPELHLDLLESTYNVGELRYQRGDYDEAGVLFERAIRGLRSAGDAGREHLSRALARRGVLFIDLGRAGEAQAAFREAIELLPLDADPINRGSLHASLAHALDVGGDLEGSVRYHRIADEIFARHGIRRHPSVAQNKAFLADLLIERGELDEAEVLVREALDIDRERLGERAPAVGRERRFLGDIETGRGRYREAVDHYRGAIDIFSEVLGPDHPNTASVRVQLGRALLELGELAAAERELVPAYDVLRKALGPNHRKSQRARNALDEIGVRLDEVGGAAQ